MARISTYEVVPVPKLADKLIGTSVGGEIEDITYNFTLLELLNLFIPNIPSSSLQGVLDNGNTATQDIILYGTIYTTNLEVTNTATLLDSYLNGDTNILGALYDVNGSQGLAAQVLSSTGTAVEWVTLPPIFTPTLQQVLTQGNTANLDIILTSNIQALDINIDTATVNNNITIDGTITDGYSSVGTSNQVLSSTGTDIKWVNLPVYSATSPLFLDSLTGIFSIQQSSGTQSGYLSASDWITFNGKQNAGNYITALTGEATATGPGSVAITLSNPAVTGKVLTGLSITGGSISAADSILSAFGKVQGQLNALVGGVMFKGVWNAFTNTPTLTSSIGTQGWYYIVDVAGTTNLNGITDWQVGDWAIFNGSTWNKIDNTDLVTSVNGQVGAVSLTTDDISEGSLNLYFTDTRARNSVSATTPLAYNNISGVFSIQVATSSQDGYLTSTDWTTFNSKQNALSGTGIVKSTSGTITYITDNSSNWNTAYNDSIVSAAVTGTSTKTLTLNQQDGGTITASWSDADTGLTSVGLSMPVAFSVANTPLTANGTLAVTAVGSASQYIRGDGQLATFPSSGGGGSSVYYYFNGSIPASVVGYQQMSNTAVIGGGTNFTLVGNGLIAQFLTDAGNPNRLEIPGGAWNFEMYFSMSSSGGTPQFYVELLKYDGVVFTSIASGAAVPETISGGTPTDLYLSSLAVPTTTLLLTDRLAVRVYIVNNSGGRIATLHTEDNNLCQIITTFSAGISAINGLTSNNQYLAVGTSGTDFAINSLLETHTFNLPTASATNRGALSSADWTTFNNKQNALTNPITGTGGANFVPKFTSISIIANSQIYDNGVGVGVGITTLGAYFDVNGTGRFNGQLTLNSTLSNGTYTYTLPSATGTLALTSAIPTNAVGASGFWTSGFLAKINGTYTVTSSIIQDDGGSHVAIGYLTNPALYMLDVNGTGKFVGQLTLGSTITNGTYTYTLPSATGTIALVGGAGVGTVTSVAALNVITAGTDLSSSVANPTTTPVITLQVPTASATARGVLSSADWTTFNNKQSALTNPVTGTGTTNYHAKFTAASTIGNSLIYDNGTNVGIGNTNTSYTFDVTGGGRYSTSLGIATTSTTNGVLETNGRIVASDGAGASRLALNIESNTSATAYSAINSYNYGTSVGRPLIINESGGKVGIGSSTVPTYNLDVTGTGRFTGNVIFGGSTTDEILTFNANSVRTGYIEAFNNGTTSIFNIYADQTATPLAFGTNGVENMRIFSGGNVLLQSGGTFTNAGYKLDVNGTGRFGGTSTYNGFLIGSHTNNVGAAITNKGNANATIYADNSSTVLNAETNLFLRTGNSDRLTIASTGAATFTNDVQVGSGGGLSKLTVGNGAGYTGVVLNNGSSVYSWLLGSQYNVNNAFEITPSTAIGGSSFTTPVFKITNTGAATFSSSVSVGGYLTGTGVNPGGLGGSRYLIDFSGGYSRVFSYGNNTSTNGGFLFNTQRSDGSNSTDVLTIAPSGSATFSSLGTGTVTASSGTLSTVSDSSYKIADGFIENALPSVMNLKPRYFYWKDKSGLDTTIRQLGFYAQEVNTAIGEEAANTPKKDSPWGINDRSVIAMLTKAIQEQQAQIKELQTKINK